jgi:hypothetical protein
MASFREAEEASKAKGISQAAVNWALQNAAKNKTPENIAIAKDAYAAQQALLNAAAGKAPAGTLVPTVTIGGAPASYKTESQVSPSAQIIKDLQGIPSLVSDVNKTIAEAEANRLAVEEAGKAAGAISKSMGGPDWSSTNPITTLTPKPADTRTLAFETFRATLALFFGAEEVKKSWVNALYASVSKFYNSGSTIDESLNLSLQDVRNNPELKTFTDRFKGIYALQDRLAKGEAIEVPTIAEYFKSESAMGDVLRQAGMADIATQDFLGNVLGLGKSVLEVTNLINDTFYSIDNAPAALKSDLQSIMNLGVSRTDIAKALLTGAEGAKALDKKIANISTFSAAKSQGVNIGMETAADIAARGFDYNKSLTGFGTVKRLERGQTLGQISGIDFTQQEAISSVFEDNVQAQQKIEKIGELESGRFAARSGRLASQSRAQGMF